MTDNSGYLEIILGPMFSGKTTQMIQIYNKYKFIDKKVFVVNYLDDKRYSDSMLSSHDEIKIECMFLNNLTDSLNEMTEADVIIINEGQFFPDIYEIVLELVEKYNKKVYICGLDGDYKRQRFGKLLDLIPFSDKITKLNSLCSNCKNGENAIFTHRITDESEQIVIGVNNYKPLCRKCYLASNPWNQMKGCISIPNIGLKKLLLSRFDIVEINEFNTSKLYNKTLKEMENIIVKRKKHKKSLHEILTPKEETKCCIFVNRDINACKNILLLGKCYLKSQTRPEEFIIKKEKIKKPRKQVINNK